MRIQSLLDLDNLTFYTLRSETDDTTRAPISNFYWKDTQSPQGYGPFLSLYEAGIHYRETIRLFKEAKEPRKNNVVYLDFVNKVKIS